MFLGGDEWGNRPLCVRLPADWLLCVNLRVPLRRHYLPRGITVDTDANCAMIEFSYDDSPGCVKKSCEVTDNIVIDYDADGNVHGVELLRIDALSDADEVEALRRFLPDYVVDAAVADMADYAGRQAERA